MKKLLLIIISVASLTAAKAQIQYKLTRLPDNITYMVSLLPQATWSFPQNVVTTAQVTVRVPVNSRFIAGWITSLVPTMQWMIHIAITKQSKYFDGKNIYGLPSLISPN